MNTEQEQRLLLTALGAVLAFLLALSLVGLQGCASPAQIVEDATRELAQSPRLTTSLAQGPCGQAGTATASASTSAQGVRATATLTVTVEQECAEGTQETQGEEARGAQPPQTQPQGLEGVEGGR